MNSCAPSGTQHCEVSAMCVMHQERLGATETEGTATAVGDPSTVSKKKTKSSQECGKSHSSGVTWGYNGGGGACIWSGAVGRISRGRETGASELRGARD